MVLSLAEATHGMSSSLSPHPHLFDLIAAKTELQDVKPSVSAGSTAIKVKTFHLPLRIL
jgi:hypothetical protein